MATGYQTQARTATATKPSKTGHQPQHITQPDDIDKITITWSDFRREYLTVKTLDESRVNQAYANTRQFYTSVGFRRLEVFPDLWGADNPCLMMVKHACQFAAQSQ